MNSPFSVKIDEFRSKAYIATGEPEMRWIVIPSSSLTVSIPQRVSTRVRQEAPTVPAAGAIEVRYRDTSARPPCSFAGTSGTRRFRHSARPPASGRIRALPILFRASAARALVAVPAGSGGAANVGEWSIMSCSPDPGPNPSQAGRRSCRLRSSESVLLDRAGSSDREFLARQEAGVQRHVEVGQGLPPGLPQVV